MSLKLEYAAVAQCRPDHLWRVLEQVEQWPRWAPDAIREVCCASGQPWTKGAKFTVSLLKPMPFALTPEVLDVDPPVYVRFRCAGYGVTGEQHYIFRHIPESNSTELRTLQEFSGVPLLFLGNTLKPKLMQGIALLFGRIIAEAEAIARNEPTPNPSDSPS